MLLRKLRKYLCIAGLLLFSLQVVGQDKIPITEEDYNNQEVEMADRLRAEGKIYVVVAVIGVILAGLIAYTVTIDRKLGRLEKELEMDGEKQK